MSASPPLHRRATGAAYRGNRPGRESVHRVNRTRVSAKRLDRCACSSPPKRSDQCSGITRRDHEATGFILVHSQHLGNRPDSGADDRLAGSHGFQNDIGETFGICGQDEEIRGLHASRHLGGASEENGDRAGRGKRGFPPARIPISGAAPHLFAQWR
jgi:hypothetical protein